MVKIRHIGETVLTVQQIEEGAAIVAEQLNKQFSGEEVVIISVVPGGILFTADLVRKLNINVTMDYISCGCDATQSVTSSGTGT